MTLVLPTAQAGTLLRQGLSCGIAALLALLAACGGGGDTTPTPATTPPAVSFATKPEAYRFLNQATFGATEADATTVAALGYSSWIDQQLGQPASIQLPVVQAAYALLANPTQMIGSVNNDRTDAWMRNAVRGPDQLRQRVAFALSEIMVVSQASTLVNMPHALADYHDMLARDAFGSFRNLIADVTLHPAMGVYLSMLGNQKPNTALNIRPDENYARELMQLLTIGLVELNIDGSTRRDAQDQPLPTYSQEIIEGFANVFTGWNYAGAASFAQARRTLQNQILPMQAYPEQHSTGTKRLLPANGVPVTLPAGQTPAQDLAAALDNIVNHPNVGPFIGKQLIQKLVTSNPSPQYVERIARVFNNDGTGQRGNLGAVVKAILLDSEARNAPASTTAGKLKEPLLRLTQVLRAYNAQASSGRYFITPQQLATSFGQAPLNSPSVFNFFSPFYAPPGEISTQGLVAPELQLATEYLNTQVTNYLYTQSFCYVPTPVTGCAALGPDTIVLDTSSELALAANSDALVTRIAERLLAGQISATLRTQARGMVDIVPASSAQQRVAEALYLISTSPDFALQR
ncbi:MAG: DUF1800 domain-containing protein [Steroidobacteraceae bacterium]